jgi:hypothetical protein
MTSLLCGPSLPANLRGLSKLEIGLDCGRLFFCIFISQKMQFIGWGNGNEMRRDTNILYSLT